MLSSESYPSIESEYDVIVVGAGPGGSTAAKEMAEQGVKVALLEKNRGPGFKLCSGGVPSRAVKDFDIDSDAIGHPLRGYHIFAENGDYTTVQRKQSTAVYRTTLVDSDIPRFDQYLANRAVQAGAALLNSTRVVELARKDRKMEVLAESPKGKAVIRAPLVIGADGFKSVVADQLGLKTKYRKADFATGIQQEYFVDSPVSEEYVYHFMDTRIAPLGFGWVYPKARGYTVGLGILASHVKVNLSLALSNMTRNHPVVNQILPKNARAGRVEAACIPMVQATKMIADNAMLVGDAAGHVDAMGGDGILFAMCAGRLAARTAVESLGEQNFTSARLGLYQRTWMAGPGLTLLNQRKKLDAILGNFRRYWELQVYLNNRPSLKRLFAFGYGGTRRAAQLLPQNLQDKLLRFQLSV